MYGWSDCRYIRDTIDDFVAVGSDLDILIIKLDTTLPHCQKTGIYLENAIVSRRRLRSGNSAFAQPVRALPFNTEIMGWSPG